MARLGKKWRLRRKGIVAPFVALSMIAVVGFVAIALDGGGLLDRRRHAQATVDAAAMAAACDLYAHYPTNNGLDPQHTARDAALAVAAANGFQNDAVNLGNGNGTGLGTGDQSRYADSTSSVTINIPPLQGPYTGRAGFVEVLVTYYQPSYFGRIYGTQQTQVQARAVARGGWVPSGFGALVLDFSGKAALNAQGNGAFTDTEGPIIVNSDNTSAIVDGGNGTLIANTFFITGGATSNGGGGLVTSPVPNQVFVGVHPTPDPLAYLVPPTQPPNGTIVGPLPVPPVGMTGVPAGNNYYVLSPGTFNTTAATTLPNFTNGDVVILQQASASVGLPSDQRGVYYLNGGGFHSSGGSIVMDPGTSGGVMFYNNPQGTSTSNQIKISGGSSTVITISPLTSGPYIGISFWQNRDSTVPMEMDGNGLFTVTGTLYAAGATLSISGNGGSYAAANGTIQSGSQIGSQYICWDLSVSGNGNVHLGYPGNVARQRVLTLVE